MRLMLVLLVAVVVQPPLVRGAMNGTVCPLYFAADHAIYVVNVDTTNQSSLEYRTPALFMTTPDIALKQSLNFQLYNYTYPHYTLILDFNITFIIY